MILLMSKKKSQKFYLMANKKNKNSIHQNQNSFFFEDFLETNHRQKITNKTKISDERLYVLFSVFFSLILVFSISILSISIQPSDFNDYKDNNQNSLMLRNDIVDRNGELIARNINTFHAAIKPNLVKNKENFIIKIKLNFPEISKSKLKKNLENKKYFYLKKRLTEEEKNKLIQGIDQDIKIKIGIAGPAKLTTLINYAKICGVSATALIVRNKKFGLTKLVKHNPTEIINGLKNYDQLHFFPFGGIKELSGWMEK